MADRYDDRRNDQGGDRRGGYTQSWNDRPDRERREERQSSDRERNYSDDDRAGYRLGDTDSGRWRDPVDQGSGQRSSGQGYSDQGYGGRGQEQGRQDRWRDDRDFRGSNASGGMSGDRSGPDRMSGGMERGYGQSGFSNYSGAGRDWDSGDRGLYQQGYGQQGYGQQGYSQQGSRSGMQGGERWVVRPEGMARGEHYGKGPKGYQRSDDRIREEVSDALSDHDELDASNVEVNVQGGEVTLSGTVTERYQKRLAEDTAERVRGVQDVHNQLRVQREGQQGASPQLGMGQSSSTQTSTAQGSASAGGEVYDTTAGADSGLTAGGAQSSRNPKG